MYDLKFALEKPQYRLHGVDVNGPGPGGHFRL